MKDPETLNAKLADQNQWALDNPDAWLSQLLDLETADEYNFQSV